MEGAFNTVSISWPHESVMMHNSTYDLFPFHVLIIVPLFLVPGPDSSLEELADFLCAAQMARASDATYVDPPKPKVVTITPIPGWAY